MNCPQRIGGDALRAGGSEGIREAGLIRTVECQFFEIGKITSHNQTRRDKQQSQSQSRVAAEWQHWAPAFIYSIYAVDGRSKIISAQGCRAVVLLLSVMMVVDG